MGSHQRQNGLDPGLTCNLVRQNDPKGLALARATPGTDDRLELDSGGLDFVDVGEAHYPYQASIPDEVRKVALDLRAAVEQQTDELCRRVEADDVAL